MPGSPVACCAEGVALRVCVQVHRSTQAQAGWGLLGTCCWVTLPIVYVVTPMSLSCSWSPHQGCDWVAWTVRASRDMCRNWTWLLRQAGGSARTPVASGAWGAPCHVHVTAPMRVWGECWVGAGLVFTLCACPAGCVSPEAPEGSHAHLGSSGGPVRPGRHCGLLGGMCRALERKTLGHCPLRLGHPGPVVPVQGGCVELALSGLAPSETPVRAAVWPGRVGRADRCPGQGPPGQTPGLPRPALGPGETRRGRQSEQCRVPWKHP